LKIDTTSPTITIDLPSTITKETSVTVTGTYKETNIKEIKVNDAVATVNSDSKTYSAVVSLDSEGENAISAVITDLAVNTGFASDSITRDTTAPVMELISPDDSSFLRGDATLVFDFKDTNLAYLELDIVRPNDTQNARLQATLPADDSQIQTMSASFATYGVKSANYNSTDQIWTIVLDTTNNAVWRGGATKFYIEVGDTAGNQWGDMDGTLELRTWTIDNIAPTISFTSPTSNEIFIDTALINFTGTDSSAITCSYKVDSSDTATTVPCGTATDILGLSDGWHSVVLTVTDAAGNFVDSDAISFFVNVDDILTVGSGKEFATITAAIDAAKNDNTISVSAGTYEESIVIPGDKTGLKLVKDNSSTGIATIQATTGDAITIEAGANDSEITGFSIDCQNKSYGINASKITTRVKVAENTISGYSKNGIIIYGGSITIENNKITGSKSTTFSVDSIYTRDGVTATITGNDLSGNIFENIAGGSAAGISIHAGDKITATGNTIHGNSIGIHAKSGSTVDLNGGASVEGKNSISLNVYDFYFEDDDTSLNEVFDLSNNWWGTSDKSAIKVFGNVDFTPWYLDENFGKLSDATSLTVGATGEDFTSIQAAVDAVASSSTDNATISVAAGTYNENIIVPAGLTGLTITGNSKADTFIKVDSGDAITLNSPTKIEKFTIDCQGTGKGKDGIQINGGNGNVIQNNNIINYTEEGILVIGGTATISDNVITGIGGVPGYSTDSIYTKSGATVTISGNTLSGNVYNPVQATTGGDYSTAAGVSAHPGDNVTVTDNIITGNTFGIHVKGAASGETVPQVSVTGNQIYGNAQGYTLSDYEFGFFYEERGLNSSSKYDATQNWWGTARKFDIEKLVSTDYVNFDPWYLNNNVDADTGHLNGPLSSTDDAAPVITLSHAIGTDTTRTSVKAGDIVIITATITDANKLEDSPEITITNGQVVSGDSLATTLTDVMTRISTDDPWTYSWIVPTTDTGLGNVTADISVAASDIIGNTGTSGEDVLNFTIDNTAPSGYSASIDQTFINSLNDKNLSFTFAGAEVGTEYKYTINDGTTTTTEASGDVTSATQKIENVNVSALADGALTLSVTLTDKAGNVGSVETDTILKDTAAPILSEVVPVATPGNNPTPTYIFNSDEAGTITYGGDCSSATTSAMKGDNSIIFKSLADGTYSACKIKVTDAMGNESEELEVLEFLIDTLAPEVSLVPMNSAIVTVSNPEIKAVFSESASGINVGSISVILDDGDDVTNYSYPSAEGISFQSSNLWEGKHTIKVSVSDNAGNISTIENEFLTRITDKSITIYATDNILPADGTSTTTITATMMENNEAAEGMPIKFSTTSGAIETSAITDVNGKATVTLTAPTNLEPAEVRASFGTGNSMISDGTYIQFT
ncbi:MAG: right-handed parallel beta-helix repeat-containing protein, partial [Candidatus Paceibacterota bacterium]